MEASRAHNPWVALDVATDPVAHACALRRAHEDRLVRGRATTVPVRKLVLQSWMRSLAAGVAPEAVGAPGRLTPDQLDDARQRSPLAPAVGVIYSALSSIAADSRHIVAIGDTTANLLWMTGDPGACERALAMHFQEGASWSECDAGTNAVGTAVALNHPIQIFSAEHVIAAAHPWTCAAAPIHAGATASR